MLFLGAEKGHSYGRFPWVSVGIVLINVVVYSAQVSIGESFTNSYSLVPEEITTSQDVTEPKFRRVWIPDSSRTKDRARQPVSVDVVIKHYPGPVPIQLTLLTSMFLHGGFFHLFFNMWCLLIFSRYVECAMGHTLFLAFYLACGLFAGLAHVASDMHSIVPCLGASGAIAGVMGAYVSIFPLSRVKVWFIVVFDLPAMVVLALWALAQYVFAVMDSSGGVAYWAHLGGFLAGVFMIRLIVFVLAIRARGKTAVKKGSGTTAKPEESTHADPEPDPYAGFITMQTVRRMQENKNPEN